MTMIDPKIQGHIDNLLWLKDRGYFHVVSAFNPRGLSEDSRLIARMIGHLSQVLIETALINAASAGYVTDHNPGAGRVDNL